MDQERPEPIDRLSFLPSFFQPTGIVKGGRRLVEQTKHRKVDLAVPIIASRVDQARYLVLVDEDIAAPQIAMEQRYRGRRRDVIGEAIGERLTRCARCGSICGRWQARRFSAQNVTQLSVLPLEMATGPKPSSLSQPRRSLVGR